jgi:hypothetical protein
MVKFIKLDCGIEKLNFLFSSFISLIEFGVKYKYFFNVFLFIMVV